MKKNIKRPEGGDLTQMIMKIFNIDDLSEASIDGLCAMGCCLAYGLDIDIKINLEMMKRLFRSAFADGCKYGKSEIESMVKAGIFDETALSEPFESVKWTKDDFEGDTIPPDMLAGVLENKGDNEFLLGCWYREGCSIKVEPEYDTGMSLLIEAADRGHHQCQAYVGAHYFNKFMMDESAAYYEKSALGGCSDGEYMYGFLLQHGVGVDQDLELAKMYISRAAKKGVPQAIKALLEMKD